MVGVTKFKLTNMSKSSFHVLYDGPALVNHEMSVRDLAPALLALGDMLDEANSALNDARAKVTVQVRASFKTGCFGIELDVVQSLIQQAHSLFGNESIASAKELLEWVGLVCTGTGTAVVSLLKFLKWLRGRKIKLVTLLENGNMKVMVGEDSIEVEEKVIALYRRTKLRQALEDVLKPLDKDGIDEFAVTDKAQSERFLVIKKNEVGHFKAPIPEPEKLGEEEVIMNLQLVTVAFREDNKWRFSDGSSTFYAQVLDQEFLNQVQSNEPFAKGDILKARLNRIQLLSGEDMKTEYRLLQVLEHRRSGVQLPIPFSIPDNEQPS